MTRSLIALTVVGVISCARVLAYSDPPDPTWIAGFWDDADYDDVINRVTSTASTAETRLYCALEPHWVPIWAIPLADDRPTPGPAFASHRPRGPPAA